jgi:hypothetical protein
MRRFAIRFSALTLLLTAAGAAQSPVISSLKGSVSVRNGDAPIEGGSRYPCAASRGRLSDNGPEFPG